MRKKLLAFILIAMGVGVVNVSSPKVASASYNADNWHHVKSSGSNPYTVTNDAILVENNTSMRLNYFVTNEYKAIGEYEISVDIQGTMGFPNDHETQAGIVPWYLDDNNYIIAYMDWSATERPSQMRQIQITGRINGQNMVAWKEGFVQSEWNDIWTDGVAIPSSDSINFKVKRTISEDKDTYTYYCFINNEQIGFYAFREAVQHASKPAEIGVYGYADNFTFKNFTYTNLNTVGEYQIIDDNVVAKAFDTTWTKNENEYSITTNEEKWEHNLVVINNPISEEKYKINLNLDVKTDADNSAVGLLAWYLDEYNYLGAVVKKENGTVKVGFEGKTTILLGASKTETLISELKEENLSLSSLENMTVIKQGSKFTLSIGGVEYATYSNPSLLSDGKYGLIAGNTNVKYTSVSIEEIAYNPYDWYTDKLGTSTTYFISAKTDKNPISYSSGTYTFSNEGIDNDDASKISSIYFTSNKVDNVAISADFTNITASTIYGFYGWIEDSDNYLLVEVTPNGIILTNHFGTNIYSETFPLKSGITYAGGTKSLSVEIKDGYVFVSWYGIKIVKQGDFAIVGNDTSISPNVGLVAGGSAVSVSNVKVSGYTSYSLVEQGNWDLYGAHYDTWKVDEENKIVTGNLRGGTTFKSSNALYPNTETKDFYMSAIVNVKDTTASEFKTGFMPYYKDSGNHIIVWLSQWAGSSPNITVTGWLNGKCIGAEWREQKVSFDYAGTDNKVEVQIVGDDVKVYLNQSFNPSFTTTFEGLSSRDMENAYVGFNIFNTTTEFKDYTLVSQERQFVLKSKPVISESNARVTEAKLGDTVKLPIFTATNDALDILNANVKVTDPDGIVLEIERNRFVASKLGKYHVNVTCVDNWGNEADPIDYDIEVKETISEPGGDTNTSTSSNSGNQENTSTGCGGCAKQGTSAAVILCSIALLGLVFFKKKD